MKLLGSTEYEDKEYAIEDTRGFYKPIEFGLKQGFYGGRVDKVAGTEVKGLYMLVEKHKVIDLMLVEQSEEPEIVEETPSVEDVDYYNYTNDELRSMLLELDIEAPNRATKDELVALFSIERNVLGTTRK